MAVAYGLVIATIAVILFTLYREEETLPRTLGAFLTLLLWAAVQIAVLGAAAYVVLR